MDQYLEMALQYLIQHWNEPNTGIVAAALIDGEKQIFATSYRSGDNWYHAERNAFDSFKQKFGQPSSNSIIISTLSPCIHSLKYRKEPSCCDLISELGIKSIHFGVLDTHHASSLDTYRQLGFNATLTQDSKLNRLCIKLMNLFSQYESRINTDLIGIKKELGDAFFNV